MSSKHIECEPIDYQKKVEETKLLALEFIQEQLLSEATKNSPDKIKAITELLRSI